MGLGGAQKFYNVIPDLTTLGKAIAGGGVPVSALVGKKDIMQLLVDKTVTHAGTFNGYPLGMAAIKATFSILERNNEQPIHLMNEKINVIHAIFQEKASLLNFPLVIQGLAGCASYHCSLERLEDVSDYTYDIMSLDIMLNNILAKHGILVSTFSRLYPNILLSNNDVEWFRDRVGDALLEMKLLYDQITCS